MNLIHQLDEVFCAMPKRDYCQELTIDEMRKITRRWPLEYKIAFKDRLDHLTQKGKITGHRLATERERSEGVNWVVPMREKMKREQAIRHLYNEMVEFIPKLQEAHDDARANS